ncbi:MAG TPA: hypothetical protein VI248_25570 [Kineosporiaceae bacterium]
MQATCTNAVPPAARAKVPSACATGAVDEQLADGVEEPAVADRAAARPRRPAANPVDTCLPSSSITRIVDRWTGTRWPITTSATRVVISGAYVAGAFTSAGNSPTTSAWQSGQHLMSAAYSVTTGTGISGRSCT